MAPSYASAARMRYYSDTASAAMADEASPHRLISMLYDGVLERLATARSAIGRADVTTKLRSINSAMQIVEHLRVVLDHKAGGLLAERLDALYEYALRRMTQANAANDADALAEVSGLIMTVKSGWDQIAPAR
ncbi:MAG: flagellar biosynthesis protein FliS [Hydrocarboniphaga sp.]|uniref:flagellar export chaperone FliS n=1 Tax=Hydrocarboniphaga sp. TaxID=2033016 RepID=UPI002612DA69|nr:flagellar export chaperone FliS [Hydrocarboniphaga sp.]MDB5970202.1 flagellar biosynthesis protein FliS [Hydrocarboniphaga sp.]